MPLSRFLYNHILPTVFRLQDYTDWFTWVPILGDFVRIKIRAVEKLNLKAGDSVLVYSVGAGFELDFIRKKIGEEGFVVAVDISEGMLRIAREKVAKNKWTNVKLVQADVRTYDPLQETGRQFDAALSNFGYLDRAVLQNLIGAVKSGGVAAISGPQPLKGLRKLFYPVTFVPEMLFGLTWKTLNRFPMYVEVFRNQLANVQIDERTFAKYLAAVSGIKK